MKFYTNTFCFIVAFCLFGEMALGQANPFQKVDTTKARLKIKYKNQNSAVDLSLDVNEQEFYLEFNGKDLQSNLMNPEDTIVKKDKKTG